MRIVPSRARAFGVMSLLGIWTVLTYACTGGIENPAYVYAPDSGNGLGTNSITPGADICGKFGGYANVKLLADSVITTAKADCHIAPIIDDTDTHLHECFQQFVGNSFLCPGVTFTAGTSKDSSGEACETFLPGVKLSPLDWAEFAGFDLDASNLSAAASVLKARGLSTDELLSVGAFFALSEESVANTDVRSDKYTKCASGCGGDACDPDAGTPPPPVVKDSGAGTPKDTGVADAPTDG